MRGCVCACVCPPTVSGVHRQCFNLCSDLTLSHPATRLNRTTHLASGDHSHLAPISNLLAAAGFRTLRYDLVGRGFSSCPGLPHSPELFVAQLTELLFTLDLGGGGGGGLHLCGCSLGGAIAASFAALHPSRVATLTLIATAGLPFSSAVHIGARAPLLPDLVFRFFLWQAVLAGQRHEWSDPRSRKASAAVAAYRRRCNDEPALGRSLLSTCRYFPMGELRHTFEDLASTAPDRPTLVVWGDGDRTCPHRNALILSEQILPHASLVTIKGARHCVYSEHSAEVSAAIAGFLRPLVPGLK